MTNKKISDNMNINVLLVVVIIQCIVTFVFRQSKRPLALPVPCIVVVLMY